MSAILTDYTKKGNPDTMMGGAISSYRMLYWMKDILCNFMADPINIKDARICKILNMQNGATPEQLNALFDVGVAYSESTKKAGTTPKIFISLGPRQYPVRGINQIGAAPIALCGATPMYEGVRHKVINMVITIMTERHDSTVVLTDLMEDFLLINENELIQDNGMISEFHVTGVSEPQYLEIGKTPNAKCLYQQKIAVQAVGGISWTKDTQGPVYRGMQTKVNVE
jgi:hypothetical protein